jgi:signal transduction histidine kinase
METAVWIVVALVLGAVGYALGWAGGRAAGREAAHFESQSAGEAARRDGLSEGKQAGRREARMEVERRLKSVADAVRRGRKPEGAEPGSPEAELHRALEAGWTPREEERQRALREAIGRVSGFLDKAVRAPLADAGESADAQELRERIDRALGSLQDLDFFLKDPGRDTEGRDLPQLVQQVTREFASDQGISVRLRLDGRPLRARVNAPALMDALYLVLHNAGRFGGPATVDVTVEGSEGRAVVKVRDRGPGFTEEAFERAFDPFFSTTDDGLGLGLPHARRTVEGMGGRIELRNVPDGGAEVELSFPAV